MKIHLYHPPDVTAMTLPEAAAKYGLDPVTLRQAAVSGTLTAENQSGRLWVTTEDAVQQWMATRRRGRRPAAAKQESEQ